ncbi:MAG: hypothetical protein R3E82_02490 [Pseudomonadales bacterium]|nr:hypothetical protein [Pseudomonadales bacterium]
MNRILGSVLCSTLFLAGTASAAMNYTYLEGAYVNSEVDVGPFDVDGDGVSIGGSFAVVDKAHLFGSYTTQDFDFGVDIDVIRLGGGINLELSNMLDFVATAAYVDVSVDGGSDDDGYELTGGLRSQLTDQFQLDGRIAYTDLGNGSDDTSLLIDARFFVVESLAIAGGVEIGDDATTWKIGVRWELPR